MEIVTLDTIVDTQLINENSNAKKNKHTKF